MAKKKQRFHQGIFNPKNPKKYLGDVFNIVYRSSWELKFFIFCDSREEILGWNSEEVIVPYVNPFDGRVHRYFTDFYLERLEEGKVVKYLGEIKPYAQTQKPKQPKRVTRHYVNALKTYSINQEKWKAAYKYCKKNNINFALITENHPILK